MTVNTSGPAPLIIEPCTIVTVHDGDTFRATVPLEHLWPDLAGCVADIRVAHVNAPELATSAGKAAHVAVQAWFAARGALRLLIYGREKYGRLLADAQVIASGELLSAFVLSLAGTVSMSVTELLAPRAGDSA